MNKHPNRVFPAMPFCWLSWNASENTKWKSMSPMIRLSKQFPTTYLTHMTQLDGQYEKAHGMVVTPQFVECSQLGWWWTRPTFVFRKHLQKYQQLKLKHVSTTHLWIFPIKRRKHTRTQSSLHKEIYIKPIFFVGAPFQKKDKNEKQQMQESNLRNNSFSFNLRYSEPILSFSPFPWIPPQKEKPGDA